MESEDVECKHHVLDDNVCIIKAVERYPLLYKGSASISERQAVWEKIADELRAPDAIVRSRWHILCAYFQRYLEKRRNGVEKKDDEEGEVQNDFKYEKEMEFILPYMDEKIASAAGKAAREKDSTAIQANNDLTDPEFVITAKEIELATRIKCDLSDQYPFYEVETLDEDAENQDCQHQDQDQHRMDENKISEVENGYKEDENNALEQQEMHDEMGEVAIDDVDESENILVQELIMDGEEFINEDGVQIILDGDEVLQFDDQMETVMEEVVENAPSIDEMQLQSQVANAFDGIQQTVLINNNGSRRILRIPVGISRHKYSSVPSSSPSCSPAASAAAAIMSLESQQSKQQQHQRNEQNHHQQLQIMPSTQGFNQEYAMMQRRRRAVVLKATPRVQVELTDNNAASSIGILEDTDADTKGAALDVAANAEVSDCKFFAINAPATANSDDGYQQNFTHQHPSPSHYRQQQQQQQQNQFHHQYRQQQRQCEDERTRHRRAQYDRFDSRSDNDNFSNDSNVVSTTATVEIEEPVEPSKTIERSEDTIFGELVTAMLKAMPQDRKRATKKSIMDLLLT